MGVTRDPVFRTVRMREGYDLDDVDDFVDRVIDALDNRSGRRALTADEIESFEFKISRFRESYVMDDVDDWLDTAAAELRKQQQATRTPPPPPAAPEPVAMRQDWPAPRPEAVYEDTMVAAAPPVATMYDSVPALPVTPAAAAASFADPRYAPNQSQHGYGYRQPQSRVVLNVPAPATGLHHLEVWVLDLEAMAQSFSWLFERLGWRLFQVWENGRAWQAPHEGAYVVIEQSPDMHWGQYDRKAPGLNHMALAVPERWMVDQIVVEAPQFGWRLLFPEQHPHAAGLEHYAAYLENAEGFEVEVVARH